MSPSIFYSELGIACRSHDTDSLLSLSLTATPVMRTVE